MSSLSSSLCLFTAAFCNVAVLDQKLFEQEVPHNGYHATQAANQQGLLGATTNLHGGFGVLAGTNSNNNQYQGQQSQKPRTPHQSPCAKKFQYVTNGRDWKGIIKIKNVDVNRGFNLVAEFILPQGTKKNVLKSFTIFCSLTLTIPYVLRMRLSTTKEGLNL